MTFSIRAFTRADIDYALEQTSREGWDTPAELFGVCLAHDPEGSFIAEEGDGRVGMITTTRLANTGWLGNLIVAPEWRRQGLGEALMRQGISHLERSGVSTLRLEADPPGVSLYRRLGFVDELASLRFCLPASRDLGRGEAEPMAAVDVRSVAVFDAGSFGDDRGQLLARWWGRSLAGYLVRDGKRIRGYAMVFPSTAGARIGPAAAIDGDVARALLQAVHADRSDVPLLLGIPEANEAAVAMLEAWGFERLPCCRRMVRGPRGFGGLPERVLAISSGATG